MSDITFHTINKRQVPVTVIDGETYLGAVECAQAMEYANPQNAVTYNVNSEDIKLIRMNVDGINRNRKFMNESGLFDLIIGAARRNNSKYTKQQAREFAKQVYKHIITV